MWSSIRCAFFSRDRSVSSQKALTVASTLGDGICFLSRGRYCPSAAQHSSPVQRASEERRPRRRSFRALLAVG
jgi:hypothetical protein